MSHPEPHDKIQHALDVLSVAGFISGYAWHSATHYTIAWTDEGREYCAAIRELMDMLPVEKPNELLWSSVSLLALMEGENPGGVE